MQAQVRFKASDIIPRRLDNIFKLSENKNKKMKQFLLLLRASLALARRRNYISFRNSSFKSRFFIPNTRQIKICLRLKRVH